ncbi:MAG TPA: oligopeptide/dipeptide ABC transporter ATP-binding protein [Myxococcota bacterium]|nr:oligopeptide/dipeptide ABC transporter ATP-binding protein [Myxococcota bacterium]
MPEGEVSATGVNAVAAGERPLVEVRRLKVHFPIYKGTIFQRRVGVVRAVDGVSFSVRRGETLGLVGESGCGKSTVGRALLQLHRPTDGAVKFDGVDMAELRGTALRQVRRRMQIIFQDPYASLNPRMTVGAIVAEPIETHGLEPDKTRRMRRVQELMDRVGLDPRWVRRYPHEFSGGQRQRIGIARALAAEPEFIVADEPLSALDVSIQAQILNLLQEIKKERNLTYLFIAHDLSVVRHVSDRVAVMYLGKIVELASYSDIYRSPLHPYTQALIGAVPIPDPEVEERRERQVLKGEIPSPLNPPSGCYFHTRCPKAIDRCRFEVPKFVHIRRPGALGDHFAACHLVTEHYGVVAAVESGSGSGPVQDADGALRRF